MQLYLNCVFGCWHQSSENKYIHSIIHKNKKTLSKLTTLTEPDAIPQSSPKHLHMKNEELLFNSKRGIKQESCMERSRDKQQEKHGNLHC
jgi:hypothetical protein